MQRGENANTMFRAQDREKGAVEELESNGVP